MSVKSYWYTNYFKQVFSALPAYGGWQPTGGDTFKIALFGPSYTPNQDIQAVYNDLTGQVSGQGYNTGGQVLTSKTISVASGALVLGAAPVVWSNCIFTVRWAVIYDDTNASPLSKQLVRWIDFQQAIELNNQTLTLTFDGQGNVDIVVSPPPPPSDSTPPQLVSATINTSTLVLTYSEQLDTASTPTASNYTVKVNGVAQASPTLVVVGTTTVTLTTAAAVSGGQTVTLDYTAPSAGAIQDVSGNDAPSFFNLSVQNITVTPLVDDAEFVSQNVPQSMTTNTSYPVTVVMRNNGTTSWTPAAYLLLSANPFNNNIWGVVTVQVPQVILPGANCTFNFPVQAPSLAGNYNFQWIMYTGVGGFGDLSTNVVVTVSDPIPPPTPTLTVLAPNGGENWVIGSSQTIRWVTSNVPNPSTVKAEVSRDGGSSWTTIFTGSANDGAQAWTVTSPATTTARIRVSSETQTVAFDTSDTVFTISDPIPPPATITVVSPNGGEDWLVGSVQTLRWSSSNLSDTVKAELSRDGGSTFETLFPSLTNDGSENWLVTQPAGTTNRLKVSGVSNPGVTDTSNANFTISVQQATNQFFVSTTGSDTTGTGTITNPWRTIRKGMTSMTPGSTLWIRGGSYGESLFSTAFTFPVGTSFSNAPLISAYQSEPVNTRALGAFHNYVRYMIFQNITFDGENSVENVISFFNGSSFCRLTGCRIRRASTQGALIPHTGDHHHEFINCEVDANGFSNPNFPLYQKHGLYIAGSDCLVERCNVHDNAGYGVHIFNGYGGTDQAHRNVVRLNRIHRNGITIPTGQSAFGVIIGSGTGNTLYNNLIYNNRGGVLVAYNGATANTVYFNTIFGSTVQAGIVVQFASGTIVRNNISYQNPANYADSGSATVQSNNLFGVNPLFVDSANANFHIQAGSPAINAGIAVSGITTDFDGVTRGNPPDIGAYEFV